MANLVEVAKQAGFNTLVQAVSTAHLEQTLSGEGPYTVFAPTDEAFAKLPEATLNNLMRDPEQLKQVLTYHVVQGELDANDVKSEKTARSVEGHELHFKDGRQLSVENAHVTRADVRADNGVIHAIDAVMMPDGMRTTEKRARA